MEWAGQESEPAPDPTPGQPAAGPSPAPPDVESLDARLSAIEDLCIALGQRMDGLESSLKETLTTEVRSVNADLRHNVSELGRLLVRDLGRLGRLLDSHRESIVSELRPPVAEPPSPPPATGAPGDAADSPEQDERMAVDSTAGNDDSAEIDPDERRPGAEHDDDPSLRRRRGLRGRRS